MEHQPFLHRPTLPIGATGTGSDGRTYEVLAPIDRGGMGELFLARMHRPGLAPEYTVLKRLLADLLEDDKYIAMFRSEAQVMAELDHPNIVRVVDMPRIGDRQCLAMEYVRGRNVQQMLARCMELGTHIPPEIVLGIMIEVLHGLDYAHGYRMKDGAPLELVHRDVTPGNVLVSFSGEVKLTDFGIAKSRMSLVSTTVGIVKGKARYLSPEQILGEAATPRSDIFASAAVICEMLTGVPAFDRGSVPKTLYAIVNGEMPDLDRTLPFRAPLLVETLHRALAPKPDERISTARELAEALTTAARTFGPLATSAEIGKYVSSLFADLDDPLAEFFEEGEAETVHGFRPTGAPNGTDVSDLVHDDEEPTGTMREATSEGQDARLIAAESAYAAPASTTQIVRGTPIAPPQPAAEESSQQAVDEALSALAWIQSQTGEQRARVQTPDLKQIAQDAARTQDEVPIARAAPRIDKRALLLFAAGALAGVLATFSLQALFSDPDQDPELEEDAELVVEQIAEETPGEAPPPPPAIEPERRTERTRAPRPITLDILYPRGARARIDGKLLNARVPIRGIRLTPGPHSIKVWKGRYRRQLRFDAKPGERYLMNKRIKRK